MSPEERDQKILEIHGDVKWLKAWMVEHKAVHAKYLYFLIVTAIGIIVALVK